jgi:predicted ATP-grasp superfamily ATP-dependent carboligase
VKQATRRPAPVRPATVLVTDAGKGSAVAIIRSLARRGLSVVAADSEPDSPGMRSRYARARLCYPVASTHPDRAVETLLEAARHFDVDLIIPVTDDLVLPLSAARDRFASVCRLALPDAAALATTSDKQATLNLAQRLGIPTPTTALVSTAGDAVPGAQFGWPVVVKPAASRQYRAGTIDAFTVAYANSPSELAGHLEGLAGRCSVLLQEYCPGEGHGVEVLMDGGRLLAAFQHRRLHEVPVTGGASSLRESVALDPVLLDYSVRLLGALAWTGLAMVEFKVGAGGPRLMEVNGRVWGSLPLAVKSGMDFPARLADLYLRSSPPETTEPATSYVVGRRSRNLWLETLWVATALSGRNRYPFLPGPTRAQGVAAALRLLNPGDGYDILDRHDLRPSLAELRSIATKIRRKAVRP